MNSTKKPFGEAVQLYYSDKIITKEVCQSCHEDVRLILKDISDEKYLKVNPQIIQFFLDILLDDMFIVTISTVLGYESQYILSLELFDNNNFYFLNFTSNLINEEFNEYQMKKFRDSYLDFKQNLIYNNCTFYSNSSYLHCAVNPLRDLVDMTCKDFVLE